MAGKKLIIDEIIRAEGGYVFITQVGSSGTPAAVPRRVYVLSRGLARLPLPAK